MGTFVALNYTMWEIINLWKRGEITAVNARKNLGMSRSTFYRRVKDMESE